MKIAVGGKGGSGKTTIAGTLARVLASRGLRVVALDDDSNPNLALTVGLSTRGPIDPPALPRDLLEERRDAEGQTWLELKIPVEREVGRRKERWCPVVRAGRPASSRNARARTPKVRASSPPLSLAAS